MFDTPKKTPLSKVTQQGMTLVETMSVCAIVGILSMLSVAGYSHFQKKTALSKLTQVSEVIKNRQAQFYLDARAYASNVSVSGLNLENYMKEQGYTCIHTDYASTCSDKDFTLYITAIASDAGAPEVVASSSSPVSSMGSLSLASFSLDTYNLATNTFYSMPQSYGFIKVAANKDKASETGIINSSKDKDKDEKDEKDTPSVPPSNPNPPTTTTPEDPATPVNPTNPTPPSTPEEDSGEEEASGESSFSPSIAMKTGKSFVLVAVPNPTGRFKDLKSWIALDEKSKGLSVFAPQGEDPYSVAKTGKGPSSWSTTKSLSDL